MRLSVIIPTFNEEDNIIRLIQHLRKHADGRLLELIVVDGQSTDHTADRAVQAGARLLICPRQGRAVQMNHAASVAQGDILYFVHADTLPPSSYLADIQKGLNEGLLLGGYRSEYLSDNPVFKINAWFTRFSLGYSYGGDQTLYVARHLFDKLNGFNEKYVIMEDFDFVKRAIKVAHFNKIPKNTLISTRKYKNNNFIRVSVANFIVFSMYRLGVAPRILKSIYKKLLKPPTHQRSSQSIRR